MGDVVEKLEKWVRACELTHNTNSAATARDALAEIERLKERAEQAERREAALKSGIEAERETNHRRNALVERLKADLAAARAALEPFAKIYQGLQNPGSDRPNDERCYLVAPWTGARLTFGHLRAAAEAIKKIEAADAPPKAEA